MKNLYYRRPFNVALTSPDDNVQAQLLESNPKTVDCQIKRRK